MKEIVKCNDENLSKYLKIQLRNLKIKDGLKSENEFRKTDLQQIKNIIYTSTIEDVNIFKYCENVESFILRTDLNYYSICGKIKNASDYNRYKIQNDDLAFISNFKNLKNLIISDIDNVESIDVGENKNLETIQITKNDSLKRIENIEKLTNLKNIFIVGNSINFESIELERLLKKGSTNFNLDIKDYMYYDKKYSEFNRMLNLEGNRNNTFTWFEDTGKLQYNTYTNEEIQYLNNKIKNVYKIIKDPKGDKLNEILGAYYYTTNELENVGIYERILIEQNGINDKSDKKLVAFNMLLDSLGIESEIISCVNKREKGEMFINFEYTPSLISDHGAIRVKYNNEWYYFDPEMEEKGNLNYAFCTKEEFHKMKPLTFKECNVYSETKISDINNLAKCYSTIQENFINRANTGIKLEVEDVLNNDNSNNNILDKDKLVNLYKNFDLKSKDIEKLSRYLSED